MSLDALRLAAAALTLALIAGCDREGFGGPPRSGPQLTDVQASPTSVAADDVSLIRVSATIPDTSGVQPAQVVFSSTAGIFTASSGSSAIVPADDSGHALAYLRAPRQPTSAVLTVGAGGTIVVDTVGFTPAFPDDVALDPSRFVIVSGDSNEIVITAFLQRVAGLVSPGRMVRFSATTGRFGAASVSDDSGIVRVRYTAGVVAESTAVTITGATQRNNPTATDTTSVVGQTTVTVLP